jgi:glycosyltransferase involved in cell wall biosynthesis
VRVAVYTDYTYRREGERVFAERAFALFLVALAQRLDRLIIAGKVDPGPGVAHYELPSETGFVELPYFPSLTDPVPAVRGMLGSLRGFWRVLAEVDAVWLLGPHPLAIAFVLLALARGRSVTLGVRQDFPRYVRARHPSRRWVWVAGDLLEAVWRGLARRLRVVVVGPELAAHYPPGRTLELAVSLVRAEDIVAAVEADSAYDGDELRVLSVGRLEEEKNPLLLAEIMAELRAADPRWRMLVCGEGPLTDELRRRLSELGVADHVELLGYVPHDRGLREIYRSSHALLHVSWTEGLPQVLFEAFAARLPVVATAVGGVPAAAGDAALLVEPGDAHQPVAALVRVAAEPELRRRLTEAGAQRVATRTLEAEAARVASFLGARTGPVRSGRSGRAGEAG